VERNARDPQRSGIYLFHHDRQCEFGNQTGTRVTAWQQYPREVVERWMATGSGLATDPSSGDLLAHLYYSPYGRSDHGWVIVLVARHDFFARPLARLEGKVLTLAALVLLGIVAASVVLSSSLVRPIRDLVEGVRRIGHDLSARVPVRGGDELGALAESVNRMAAELEEHLSARARSERHLRETEKLASVGEMAAGLAHELNTPLGNIRALATLARKDLITGVDVGALAADLDDIAGQTRRCAAIIEGLLRFARRDPPALARHDVTCLLGASIDLVRLRAEKKRVAISFRRDVPAMPVVADGPQLEQVFVNLLLNAVDAVPDGGRVEVAAELEAGHVRVQVRDEGPGIAAEHLSRIFDPFFTTKEVGTGTGLGLSVSYGIVRSHGGEIDVESSPGRGAVFTVSLPEAA
jgi:two-component system NtrC family sensor kinase